MKKLKYLTLIVIFAAFSYVVVANIMTWHNVSLMQIETVPNDSLVVGKDWSPMIGDSVQFTCRVVAPPQVMVNGVYKTLLRATNSWTCYAQDTSNSFYGGIVIRQGSRFTNTFLQNVDTGNIITVKGIVQEFWSTSVLNLDRTKSGYLTQIALDESAAITINSVGGNRPTPKLVNITDFAVGDYPNTGGSINYVGGEKYEGMYVELRNLTVGPGLVNRQPFSLVDANGNRLYVRDYSNFFSTSPSPASDTLRPWTIPAQGTIVNYIKGVIINCNNEGVLGNQLPYVLIPIYPNDLSLGGVPPQLSSPNKTPGVPTPTDSVSVTVTVSSTTTITGVNVFYRINGGAFTSKLMPNVAGNIFAAKLPPRPLNDLVEYYYSASNTSGLTRLLPADTSISKLFYVVKANDSLSVQDVQYCVNNGGHSGYENALVRGIEGIVTADTSDFKNYSCTSCPGGPVTASPRVIIQNGTGAFSGIWISGPPTDNLVKGQRVRVKGTVTYTFGVNAIMTSSPSDVQVISSGNALPPAENLTASVLANSKSGGDLTIKRWESVLVRINTPIRITCVNASRGTACTTIQPLIDTTFRRNFGEFLFIDNSNVESRVMLPGANHTYTNKWDGVTSGKTLLHTGDSLSFMQGILYYAYTNYKVCPRTNADFGVHKPVGISPINSGVPTSFKLNQNFPNPFNPTTRISFSLPMFAKVTVKIYDIMGREVRQLVNENMNAGSFMIDFNGSDLASGVYFVRLTADGTKGMRFADTKKMLLIK
ncbi:MAG: T9SS type A sorting domain-containing protein [Ignavibacteriae bacterium]|nr:T9SS type A sorting domain-containing protein [Ignavibacteriota bacterium]